jgi:hypothetical protein
MTSGSTQSVVCTSQLRPVTRENPTFEPKLLSPIMMASKSSKSSVSPDEAEQGQSTVPRMVGEAEGVAVVNTAAGDYIYAVPPFGTRVGWPSHLLKVRCAVPPLRWDVLEQVHAWLPRQ